MAKIVTRSKNDQVVNLLFPGHFVSHVDSDGEGTFLFQVEPSGPAVCPRCGSLCESSHEIRRRVVRDAPFPGASIVQVDLPVRRVRCKCGCRSNEVISWLSPRVRMTTRLIANIQSQLRGDVSVLHVSREFGLGWDTVRKLDQEQLSMFFEEVVPYRMTRLVIDEIAIHKGHRYLTIFMDYDRRQVFEVVEGKTIKAMRPVFERLVKSGIADQITAVGCDMNAAYPQLIKEYLPNADIVYDLFHVVKMATEGVCREARHKQAADAEEKYGKRSSEAAAARRLLRSSEYIIVTPPENLRPAAKDRLDEILADNQILAKLHPVIELLRHVWRARNQRESTDLLGEVIELLRELKNEHGLKKAGSLANTLESRSEGIVKAWIHKISTGPLEGVNNRAKLLKRIAYGYRNIEFFKLKLKAAFPGKDGNPLKGLKHLACVIGGEIRSAAGVLLHC